jgi:hypothetical protein
MIISFPNSVYDKYKSMALKRHNIGDFVRYCNKSVSPCTTYVSCAADPQFTIHETFLVVGRVHSYFADVKIVAKVGGANTIDLGKVWVEAGAESLVIETVTRCVCPERRAGTLAKTE